jgi:hypothetical protein
MPASRPDRRPKARATRALVTGAPATSPSRDAAAGGMLNGARVQPQQARYYTLTLTGKVAIQTRLPRKST